MKGTLPRISAVDAVAFRTAGPGLGPESAPIPLPPPSRWSLPETTWRVLSAAQRGEALALWQRLEQRWRQRELAAPGDVPLTVSSHWTSAWLQHYGSRSRHEFLVLEDSAGACGIALLVHGAGRGYGPLREQTRHLGTAGESSTESVCVEHNQLLVLPEYRMDFHERLVSHLLRDKSWGSLCLDGFTEWGVAEFQCELPGFETRSREAPYYDLRATRAAGGDLLDPLGRSTRQNVRRLLRKYGEIEPLWAETRAEALEVFEELQELHQARWKKAGEPGAFHSRRFRDFQRTLIEQSFDQPPVSRRVVLFRVRRQGQTVGCLMLLVDGSRLLDYLSGFGDFEVFASPGVVTHVLCMTEALRRGFDEYDFLVGEKRHKENLSTNVNRLVWANWSRTTLRSRTIRTLGVLKRRWADFRRPTGAVESCDPAT